MTAKTRWSITLSLAALLAGCGGELVVPQDSTRPAGGDDEVASGSLDLQTRVQAAAHAEILRSQRGGAETYARRLEAVLGTHGLSGFDAMTVLGDVGRPARTLFIERGQQCPFLREGRTGGVACAAIAEQAFQDLLLLDQTSQETAVDERSGVLAGELGREGSQFVALYGKAALSNGVQATKVRAAQALRVGGHCDTTAEPASDAFIYGSEEGEALLQTVSRTTLDATPRTVCDVDQIAAAARDAARAQATDYLRRTPLCPGVEPQTLAGRVDLAQAATERERGLKVGIDAGHENFRIWLIQNWQCTPPTPSPVPVTFGDPLIVDLHGDGVSLAGARVQFDLFDDGRGVWINALGRGDAFLTRDLDGDGVIGSGAELISNVHAGVALDSAVDVLRKLDGDRDGVLDRAEIEAARLGLWEDANADGACQRGELRSLHDAGLDRVHLEAIEGYRVDAYGNVHRQKVVLNGAAGVAVATDVWLSVEADALPGGTALAPRPAIW